MSSSATRQIVQPLISTGIDTNCIRILRANADSTDRVDCMAACMGTSDPDHERANYFNCLKH